MVVDSGFGGCSDVFESCWRFCHDGIPSYDAVMKLILLVSPPHIVTESLSEKNVIGCYENLFQSMTACLFLRDVFSFIIT